MVLVANQVPLGSRSDVAAEAIAAKSIYDFGNAADFDLTAVLGHLELEEFPILGGGIPALLVLDHHFRGHELNHRAGWIAAARRRVGDFQRIVEFAKENRDEEAAYRRHLRQAVECLIRRGNLLVVIRPRTGVER